jgi:hypothetical protein
LLIGGASIGPQAFRKVPAIRAKMFRTRANLSLPVIADLLVVEFAKNLAKHSGLRGKTE